MLMFYHFHYSYVMGYIAAYIVVTTQEEEVHILVYRGSLVRTSVAGKHCDALCQVHGKSVTVF